MDHVPAWKRFAINNKNEGKREIEDDPLNVTTHLATGSLTKKQKKSILNGTDNDLPKKVKNKDKKQKKAKLPREERLEKKQRVLKDQLRYLIEFYLKDSDELPDKLYQLESIRSNYDENDIKSKKDESAVVDVWKFSKQKQNWLLKHFHNFDEIPAEYDELLLNYFKDMKGRSKYELIKLCNEKLETWNKYIAEQEEKMQKIINGEENEDNKNVEQNEENKEDEEQKHKVEELPMPNKAVICRSYKLLSLWEKNKNEDEQDFEVVILQKFPEEDLK